MSKNGKKQGGIILKKYNKIIGLLLAVALLLPGMATKVSAAENDVTRLAGDNRIETSIKISKDAYANGSAAEVVLAGWEGKADALTGTYLASAKKAPLLFTRGGSLDTDLLEELERLGAKTVYALGGTTVISDSLVTALEAKGMKVERVSGDNRFATAEAAAKKVSATAKHVFLAYGWDELADALAVGPASAKEGMPILLTETNALRPETVTAMKNLGVEKVTILGGTAVVSKAIEDKLVADLGAANVTRVNGANRFSTATAIAGKYFAGATKAIVANSNPENNPDALVAGYFGALRNAPIVLTPAATLHETTAAYLKANVKEAYIVGGTTAVNAAVEAETKTAITPLDAAVVSVSAINGGQLLVTFNREVDETTAKVAGNYTLSDSGKTVSDAEVQEDGKSVLLTLSAAYDNTKVHSVAVTVQNVKVDATVDTLFPVFTKVITVEDTVKAQIKGVSSSTNSEKAASVKITFTEPVQAGAYVKINGQQVGVTTATSDVTISGLALDSSAKHTVEVVNLKDAAGNLTALATTEFTITKDTVAPTVSSVEAYGDNKLLVTFSKKMKAATLEGNIAVKDEALSTWNLVDGDASTTGIQTVTALSGDTTGTKFVVHLDTTNIYQNKNSRNFTVLFTDNVIEDSLGNKLVGTTRVATINKDTVAPKVTNVTYEKNSSGNVTNVVVTFDEAISTADYTKTVVVNSNGVLVSDLFPSAASVSGKVVKIPVKANVKSGEFNVQFLAGFATDLAVGANKNAAHAVKLNFGTSSSTDTFEIVDGDSNLTNGEVTEAGKVITVTFPEEVKGGAVAGSATDIANYTINGKALPVGTTITLNSAQKVATITLPDESIAKSDAVAVFTINNVVTLTGKTIKPFTTTVAVIDNVKPVLTSAVLTSYDGTASNEVAVFTLTFSEDMGTVSGADISDELKLIVGGNAVNLAAAGVTATATNVPGYANKVNVTVSKVAIDTTKALVFETLTVTSADLVDKASTPNVLKGEVSVTATK